MALRFNSTILIRGINPYVPVSAARAGKLRPAWRKPMPVLVRINGKPRSGWRINMMPRGDGGYYLYLHGEVREASGTKVGDRVTVEISFDEDYQGGPLHSMPPEFEKALARTPRAKKAWDALIPSRKKEVLRYLAGLKSAEAKDRNVERAIRVLGGEPGRFMARTWKDGT